jgi:hypothetical protein
MWKCPDCSEFFSIFHNGRRNHEKACARKMLEAAAAERRAQLAINRDYSPPGFSETSSAAPDIEMEPLPRYHRSHSPPPIDNDFEIPGT